MSVSETRQHVAVVLVNLICDECQSAMVSTGFVYACSPPKYPYKCPVCGHVETTTKSYPRTEYIPLQLPHGVGHEPDLSFAGDTPNPAEPA